MDSEFDQYLNEIGDIKRLDDDRVHLEKSKPKARVRKGAGDTMADLWDDIADTPDDWVADAFLSYRAEGVQASVLRKLKKGHYRVDDTTDLHGMTEKEAREHMIGFLNASKQRELRVLRVIHGRSNRDIDRGPVLKTMLDFWLRRRRDVLAFCSAPITDGGPGACYVLIKRPTSNST
ncbi:MAG: Smr/MutS family protein [Gammaproteobacteria bacterium]|nr:Smr/MutS family protein [Gammaproteobacteria bacterium]